MCKYDDLDNVDRFPQLVWTIDLVKNNKFT